MAKNPSTEYLRNINLEELKNLDPKLHIELMEFCLNLDEKEFPEAIKTTEKKYKTLYGLEKIYEKLKKKRKKEAKKRMEEAEKIILSMNSLKKKTTSSGKFTRITKSFKKIGKKFKSKIEEIDEIIEKRKKLREHLKESKRLEKAAQKKEKNREYEDAGFFYKQAGEILVEVEELLDEKGIFNKTRLFRKAIKNYELMTSGLHIREDKGVRAEIYLELAECQTQIRDLLNATDNYISAIRRSEKNNGRIDRKKVIMRIEELAIIALDRGLERDASHIYKKLSEMFEDIGEKRKYTTLAREISKENGDYEEAAELTRKMAFLELDEQKKKDLLLETINLLERYLEVIEKLPKTNKHMSIYREIAKIYAKQLCGLEQDNGKKKEHLMNAAEYSIKGEEVRAAARAIWTVALELTESIEERIKYGKRTAKVHEDVGENRKAGNVYSALAKRPEIPKKETIELYSLAIEQFKIIDDFDGIIEQYKGILEVEDNVEEKIALTKKIIENSLKLKRIGIVASMYERLAELDKENQMEHLEAAIEHYTKKNQYHSAAHVHVKIAGIETNGKKKGERYINAGRDFTKGAAMEDRNTAIEFYTKAMDLLPERKDEIRELAIRTAIETIKVGIKKNYLPITDSGREIALGIAGESEEQNEVKKRIKDELLEYIDELKTDGYKQQAGTGFDVVLDIVDKGEVINNNDRIRLNLMAALTYLDVDNRASASYYTEAGRLEENQDKKFEYYLKAGDLFSEVGDYKESGNSYLETAKILEKKGGFNEATEHFIRAGNHFITMNQYDEAEYSYSKARRIADEMKNGKDFEIRKEISEIWERQADILLNRGSWKFASRAFFEAERNIFEIGDAQERIRLIEKSRVCEVLAGGRKSFEKNNPTLGKITELEIKFLQLLTGTILKDTRNSRAMSTKDLKRAIELIRSVEENIGIVPGRRGSTINLLAKGLQELKKRNWEEPLGIPDHFLLQTLAVVENEEQIDNMKKLFRLKKLKNSKDARKVVIWHIDDNRDNLDNFFELIKISTGKSIVDNINLLSTAKLLDNEITLDGIATEKEFKDRIETTVREFITKRTTNEKVHATFMEKLGELRENGFLDAIITTYSKYSNSYQAVLPLIDIALATTVMGDFNKVKFPTEKRINSMDYLSEEQKNSLLDSVGQLEFMEPELIKLWEKDVKMKRVAKESVESVEGIRRDVEQKLHDLKYHFELHMHEREGELEEEFKFNEEYLGLVQKKLEKTEKGSEEFIKLKQIERILSSVMELEKIEIEEMVERKNEVQKYLRNAGVSMKALFKKSYGFDEEQIENLQAKVDVGELRTMLVEDKEKLTLKALRAYESSDPIHLILAGKEPENSGSCQRYDGSPNLMIGLSGYLLNAGSKIIRVENQDGIVVGRAMMKIVEADGELALFLERPYYRNSASDPNINNIILDVATKKAEGMSIQLLTSWSDDPKKEVRVVRHRGLSPYEYSDGLGGGANGIRNITVNVSVVV